MPLAGVVQHPLEDESFHGYVARLSHRLGLSLGQVLALLGLFAGTGDRTGWRCLLRPTVLAEVSNSLGLDVDVVANMTLRRYQHLFAPPDTAGWNSLGFWASRNWVLLRSTRFCPLCLLERGSWSLAWHLPEQIGCSHHGLLLQQRCPSCAGPASTGTSLRADPGYLSYSHNPRFCYSRPRRLPTDAEHVPPCGADLASAPRTRLTPRQSDLVRLVDDIHLDRRVTLAGCPRIPVQARQLLREAACLARHRAASAPNRPCPGARGYLDPIEDPQEYACLLEGCAPWLLAANPASALNGLRAWLVAEESSRAPVLKDYQDKLGDESVLSGLLRDALRSFGRPSSRLNRSRAGQPNVPAFPSPLPQLIWACALPVQLRHSTKPAKPFLRAVLSLQIVRIYTRSWREAGEALRLPTGKAQAWSRYVYDRLTREQVDELVSVTPHLGARLLASPGWAVLPVRYDRMPPLTEALCVRDGAQWCPCSEGTDL